VIRAALTSLATTLCVLWVRSLRPGFIPALSPETFPRSGILVLWHADMLPCLRAFAGRGMRVLISSSRDGDFGAQAAGRLGYRVIRGSSSRGGATALKAIARSMAAEGGWVAFVADGPRGPRAVSKPGAVWLSEMCDVPVVAGRAHASLGFTLGGWARVRVPLPFSRVTVRLSDPFHPKTTAELDAALESLKTPVRPGR